MNHRRSASGRRKGGRRCYTHSVDCVGLWVPVESLMGSSSFGRAVSPFTFNEHPLDPLLRVSFRQNLTRREKSREEETLLCRQMVAVLKQAEVGVAVVEVCRRVGITEQTLHRWKKKYVGLEIDQVRQLKQLQEENGKLKKLVAELSLDKAMLQDVLGQKNSKALVRHPSGALPVRPCESATCVSHRASRRVDSPIPKQTRAESSAADSRSPRSESVMGIAESGCC